MTYTVSILKGQRTAIANLHKYDFKFKRNVLLLIEQGHSVRSDSQALGVAKVQLHKWTLAVDSPLPIMQEVAVLRDQLRLLQIERDILEKVTSI